jgi:hypothetical protein
MSDVFKKVIGTPTMMWLPARNYTFKVFEQDHSITIPRKGKYVDFDDKLFTEEDGEFNIMDHISEETGHVLFVPSLSKVLFATSKYPNLEDDQAFIPIAIVIRNDEVEIIGNVIQMLKEN